MSHITNIQQDIKMVEKRVKNLFNLTDEQYAMITYNTGRLYLHKYLYGNEPEVLKLEKSKLFWNYWVMQIYQSDKKLLKATTVVGPGTINVQGYILNTTELRADYYDIYHQDREKSTPPKVVYDELKVKA